MFLLYFKSYVVVTQPKSRANAWITHGIRVLRDTCAICVFHAVCLTWNLRSCPPMFAGSALNAIPGFEQLKTRLRVRVYAVLRCFTQFYVVYIVLMRTMREICVEYQWSFTKMLPLSRSSTTFHWRSADIWRMFRACNTYVSLKITGKKIIDVCISNRTRK